MGRHGCEKDSVEIVIEEVSTEGSFQRGGRIRAADRVFEANCSKQMGERKKTIFH